MGEDKLEQVQVHKSVLQDMTDEQLDSIRKQITTLAAEDEAINMAMTVMIIAPQIYQLARLSLQQELLKEGYSWEDGLEEAIIKLCGNYANQRISRQEVFDKARTSVLKFLTEDLSKQYADEQAERARQRAELHARRLSQPVVLQCGEQCRGAVVVVYGDEDNVKARCQQELSEITSGWNGPDASARQTIIRLSTANRPQTLVPADKAGTLHNLQVGANQWMGIANSSSKCHEQLNGWASVLLDMQCDVLYAEDGRYLHTGGAAGRNLLLQLEDGLKRMRRWAQEAKAVLLVAVPFRTGECGEQELSVLNKLAEHVTLINADEKEQV